jgi:hypothetical protein
VADDLPGLTAWGEALADRVRRDELSELGLAGFGDALLLRAAGRPRSRLRAFWLGVALALPIAATSGAATALVLKTADVGVTDPAQVPDEQTPLAGTARVSAVRAADPQHGYPWAIRIARSKTGFTCTTVGQVHDRVFGLVGLDGVFRRLPGELSDSCGQGGALVGARIVDGNPVRTIVYGAAGDRLRRATLLTAQGERDLKIGEGGTFLAALTGYPEDRAAGVRLTFPGHTEEHNFGAATDTVTDPEGGQAWRVEMFTMGTRYRCAHVRIARAPAGDRRIPVTPTACLGLKLTDRAWVADARVLKPGHHGPPGFDRWSWHQYPARTVVWGVARRAKTVESVTLLGAGAPRRLTISGNGAFAAVLPASTDPAKLRLRIRLATGETQTERPGAGLVPDLVKGRR